MDHVVCFAQDDNDPVWPFSLETGNSNDIKIELGVLYHSATSYMEEVAGALPDRTTVMKGMMCVLESAF